jgi:hypothetical protein
MPASGWVQILTRPPTSMSIPPSIHDLDHNHSFVSLGRSNASHAALKIAETSLQRWAFRPSKTASLQGRLQNGLSHYQPQTNVSFSIFTVSFNHDWALHGWAKPSFPTGLKVPLVVQWIRAKLGGSQVVLWVWRRGLCRERCAHGFTSCCHCQNESINNLECVKTQGVLGPCFWLTFGILTVLGRATKLERTQAQIPNHTRDGLLRMRLCLLAIFSLFLSNTDK